MGLRRYVLRVLIAADQLANAALGGDPGETISDSLHRHNVEGARFACILCRFLDLFERDHCRKSFERGVKRMRDALAAPPSPSKYG